MARDGFFIDTNLLILLVVGSVGRDLIAKHRRLEGYTGEDYDALMDLLGQTNRTFVTPNTLTEASNLLGQHGEPERSLFFQTLQSLIHQSQEIVVASVEASRNHSFTRLGLTDAALLEAITSERPLLTVDLDLYLEAIRISHDAAVNFTHFRELP